MNLNCVYVPRDYLPLCGGTSSSAKKKKRSSFYFTSGLSGSVVCQWVFPSKDYRLVTSGLSVSCCLLGRFKMQFSFNLLSTSLKLFTLAIFTHSTILFIPPLTQVTEKPPSPMPYRPLVLPTVSPEHAAWVA